MAKNFITLSTAVYRNFIKPRCQAYSPPVVQLQRMMYCNC